MYQKKPLNRAKLLGWSACLCVGLWACGSNADQVEEGEDALVASWNNQNLKASALRGLGLGLRAEDSLAQAKLYIEQWFEREVMFARAEKQVSSDEQIEAQMAEYRRSLLVQKYERQLLAEKLDSVILEQELAEYYAKHKELFRQGHEWLRCHFIKVPKNSAQAEQLKAWFAKNSHEDLQKLREYYRVNRSGSSFILNEDAWIKLERLSFELPEDEPIEAKNLRQGQFIQRSDAEYDYLLRVFEYRGKDEPSPMRAVENDIRQIILYQRQEDLLRAERLRLYEEAKSDFKTY